MKKFGTMLISRPAGREAFLAASAYLLPSSSEEEIELDFGGVNVVAPSWLDEFLSGLKGVRENPVKILPSKNSSLIESLKAIQSH